MIRFIYSADATEATGGKLADNAPTNNIAAEEPANNLTVSNDTDEEPTDDVIANKAAASEPDEEVKTKKATGSKTADDAKTKSAKGYTPDKDADMKTVVDRICASWKLYPAITLAWITQPDMESLAKTFSGDLADRQSAGGDRPSITSLLQQQNADMDAGATEVKVYIEKKYKKKNAKPQFPRFGIGKYNNAYMLPRDQSQRLLSLDLMIAAIAKDGFSDEEYGTAFWTDMKKTFGDTLASASSTDGTVSGKVSGKDVARRQLVKIMTALRLALRANYPDTYQAVYREWGWQKQSY